MITLNEPLTEYISSILTTVNSMVRMLEKSSELSPDQKQLLSLRCAEVALLSLAASDELGEDGSPAERMIRHELAAALRQIALQCLNVQEWEDSRNIMAYIAAISKRNDFIAGILKLPEKTDDAMPVKMQLVPCPERFDDLRQELLAVTSERGNREEELKAEIQALREILTVLVLERDKLLNTTCKELEAEYLRELGSLEAEIYRAECEIRYLRRKTEMMRSALNRRENVNTERIDESLKEQVKEYQRAYEEFKRRASEAEAFQKKRKKTDVQPEEKKEEESEEKRLKKLYRKIVKAMHPDIHPNQTEEEKALFKRANLAYEAGDYKALAEIAATIDGDESYGKKDFVGELLREKERLLTLIRNVKAEIRLIKTRYPYTKKKILEDPEKLAEEKERLRTKLAAAVRAIEVYRKHIEEMGRANGRTDTADK